MTFLNEEALADCAILCALSSEMLLQSVASSANSPTNASTNEKGQDLEFLYLKRLKSSIEKGVLAKTHNSSFFNNIFDEA